jgi:hypothetical protein
MTTEVYELRVRGHLDRHWAGWLGDLTVTHHQDGTSTLTGPVLDQAALHGLLAKVSDLGIALISVGAVAHHSALSDH